MSIATKSSTGADLAPTKPAKTSGVLGAFQRLHFLAGIFAAPLLIVAALSGFLYALAPSIEQVLYKNNIAATSGMPSHSVDEQINAARTVYPDLDIKGVQVAENSREGSTPDTNTRVLFSDSSLISSSYTHAVFVDPGSLEIKGDLIQYGSSSALPFRSWISEGHRRLWLGDPGRVYSEMAASWLGPLAVSGLGLWMLHRRRTKKQKTERTAARHTRRFAMRRHSNLGLLAAPGMIFLCVSGLTWSLWAGDNIATVREQLNWLPPKPPTSISAGADGSEVASVHEGHEGHEGHQNHMDHATQPADGNQAERVLEAARNDNLTGTVQLAPPSGSGEGWVVSEIRQPYLLHNDAVSVDGNTGEIFARTPFSSWPITAQVTSWIIQLHMGTLFGIFSEVALALLALAILGLVIYGYIMWFKRGRGSSFGSLPATTLWRDIPVWARVAIIASMIGYAALAPLFGVSVVAFLLVDAVWRLVYRRKTPSSSTISTE